MKLVIVLENGEDQAEAIKAGLGPIPIEVLRESGRTILVTDSLFPETLNIEDHEQVHSIWSKVRELVAIIDGAGQLEGTLPPMSLQNLANIAADGTRNWMPITGRADLVAGSFRTRPPDASPYIALALIDSAVAKALRLFSGEKDWVNLYRIYEVIKEDSQDGIVSSGWASERDIESFKMCANNATITGDLSRHGSSGGAPSIPAISRPMATHMIGNVLRQWLNAKVAARNITI